MLLTEVVSSNKSDRPRILVFISIFVFLGLGLLTTLVSESTELSFLNALPQVCPLRVITGYLCAFCGMTHAWIYFWHGDFVRALQENMLSLILYFGLPVFLLSLAFNPSWSHARTKKASWVVMGVLAFYTVARNLK